LVTGVKRDLYFSNPFIRWHKNFEQYSTHLTDINDFNFNKFDHFERFKPFNPLDKHVVGSTPAIPR